MASVLTRASHEETHKKDRHHHRRLLNPYYSKALKRLIETNPENCDTICEYILAEQTKIDLKDSTKEDKIKVPIWLSFFLGYKPFHNIMKKNRRYAGGISDWEDAGYPLKGGFED